MRPSRGSPKRRRRRARPRRPGPAEVDRPGSASGDRSARGSALRRALGSVGAAFRQGAGETRGRLGGVPRLVAIRLLALLGVLAAIFFDLVGFVLNLLIGVLGLLAGPGRAVLGLAAQLTGGAARLLTPERALALAVAGAAVLLALSQFADYRGISVGIDAYADVETVAPAPEVERQRTGSAHSYALLPVAALALLLLVPSLRGRWRLSRLIALCGLAAIVVGIAVDRPAGLDPGDAAFAFESVEATLLGGFYAQIFAGLLLFVSALMLGRQLRLAGARRTEPASRGRRKVPAGRRRTAGARA